MSCGSCGTTSKNGVPNGCQSNGNCGTGSCGSKLQVFDWLSNMSLPTGKEKFNIYEVRFKNGRKLFYKNTQKLSLFKGDVVVVQGNSGYDVGTISIGGELVKVQMKKRNVAIDSSEILNILRKPTQKDLTVWEEARVRESDTQYKGRIIISKLGLKMKLSDVEYQGDGKKAIFYYTADERVDFRQLIRELASTFLVRIEMKQVGMRQEASRLGGIGSCGRELCCSTWLTDFRKVNTSAARYQQLSLNPLKLSGQCGKLKCCLNYELDSYLDALKAFPKKELVLKTKKGEAVFVKMDIFKELVWYAYKEERFKWFQMSLQDVQEIIALNKNNKLSSSLEDYEITEGELAELNFESVVGQDSLTRFDNSAKKQKRNKSVPKKQSTCTDVEVVYKPARNNRRPTQSKDLNKKNKGSKDNTKSAQIKTDKKLQDAKVSGDSSTPTKNKKKPKRERVIKSPNNSVDLPNKSK